MMIFLTLFSLVCCLLPFTQIYTLPVVLDLLNAVVVVVDDDGLLAFVESLVHANQ